ncbi:dihydroxyacetone kinase subunit L, partial [Mesorhizobium sp. M7A.F.Ca.CA.004.05.1.1]
MLQLSNDRSFDTAGKIETGNAGDMAALNLARLIAAAADTIAAH